MFPNKARALVSLSESIRDPVQLKGGGLSNQNDNNNEDWMVTHIGRLLSAAEPENVFIWTLSERHGQHSSCEGPPEEVSSFPAKLGLVYSPENQNAVILGTKLMSGRSENQRLTTSTGSPLYRWVPFNPNMDNPNSW